MTFIPCFLDVDHDGPFDDAVSNGKLDDIKGHTSFVLTASVSVGIMS